MHDFRRKLIAPAVVASLALFGAACSEGEDDAEVTETLTEEGIELEEETVTEEITEEEMDTETEIVEDVETRTETDTETEVVEPGEE